MGEDASLLSTLSLAFSGAFDAAFGAQAGLGEGARWLVAEGGALVLVILGVIALLWALILERYLFLARAYEPQVAAAVARWRGGEAPASWSGQRLREAEIARLKRALDRGLSSMHSLLSILPLLGLLGTVSGMIDLFDDLNGRVSGAEQVIAGHIARITLPTLVGMAGAVSALLFVTHLARRRQRLLQRLPERFAEGGG